MRINVINKDANNFKLQITDLDLPNKIMVNYINRSKALLDNNYGKGSILFKFEIAPNQKDITVMIPYGYYNSLKQINNLLTAAYDSLENNSEA